jgi:hypothetical protein
MPYLCLLDEVQEKGGTTIKKVVIRILQQLVATDVDCGS